MEKLTIWHRVTLRSPWAEDPAFPCDKYFTTRHSPPPPPASLYLSLPRIVSFSSRRCQKPRVISAATHSGSERLLSRCYLSDVKRFGAQSNLITDLEAELKVSLIRCGPGESDGMEFNNALFVFWGFFFLLSSQLTVS